MRYLKACILSVFISGGSFVFGAVFLGIFNIYLSGHGIDWPNQDFDFGPLRTSPLNLALQVFVLLVFVFSYVIILNNTKIPEQEHRG